MAMLAEPRRRKRYNLCPRGKALYEGKLSKSNKSSNIFLNTSFDYFADDNRFGTKMLEKMGWEKGQGLGARKDGDLEFVRVRFKNDAEGLGYEARDDQWTVHEEGFNGLLKTLNGGDPDEDEKKKNASDSEEEARPMGFGFKAPEPEEAPSKKKLKEKISGVSLEEKSKQSRARVHYKKFTRGKDLSQYSEKDLANIFGKKEVSAIETPAVAVEEPQPEKEVNPNFGGVQTVSTGLSVSDYFKQKMEAMKSRLKSGSNPSNNDEQLPNDAVEEVEEEPVKKKKKKKDREVEEKPTEEEPNEQPAPKQKKKKKSKRPSEDEPAETEAQTQAAEETNPPKRKKKKENKEKDIIPETEEVTEEPAPKKKDKKNKGVGDAEVALTDVNLEEASALTEETSKKKKKKSKKQADEEPTLEAEAPEKSSKKSKKSKLPEDPSPEEIPEGTEKPSKKSKKSKSFTETVPEGLPTEETTTSETTEKTSKKSKKSKAPEESADAASEDKEAGRKRSDEVSPVSQSSGDKGDQSADEDQPEDLLSLDEMKAKLNSFNICTISQFCADKFQMFELEAFRDSTLAEIVGYGCSENVELTVVENPHDEQRILDLWKNESITKCKKASKPNIQYPRSVRRTTIRAVKKRVVFGGI
ncbi:hypothetical protein KR018_007932 [Drosophila ironensis]|nr:hypothetical protein KR018_007932 [Drosophila ironensis]